MMKPEFDVVGLGNAIIDVIASVPDGFLKTHSIPKGAMNLIDEERAQFLTQKLGTDVRRIPGGSGANTIAGIASFGGSGGYMGKVFADPLGKIFYKEMERIGVHYQTAPLKKGPATARSIIVVTPDGERSMNTFLGASTVFSASDVNDELIRKAKILYLEGYLFDREEAKTAFIRASEVAQAAERQVSLTLSDRFCVDRHRESFRHLVKHHVDLLFANEDELMALYETDDFDTALAALRTDAAVAAITRGAKGSVVVTPDEVITAPAEPVKKVVDATGAGDQYAAGFLFGYARNRRVRDCAKLGHIAAAEVISHYGPRPEISYRVLAERAGVL